MEAKFCFFIQWNKKRFEASYTRDREYSMIYRGPVFLWFKVWLLPPSHVSKLSLFISLPLCRRSSLLTGEAGEKGVGEDPNHTTARNPGPLCIIQCSLLTLCYVIFNVA